MKQVLAGGCLLIAIFGTSCKGMQSAAEPEPKTTDDKIFYALGVEFGRHIVSLSISPAELAMVKAGLSDAVARRASKVDLEQIHTDSVRVTQERQRASASEEKKKGLMFTDEVARDPSARRLDAGVVVQKIQAGNGPKPGPTDIVKVSYEGHLLDGTVFDNTYTAADKPLEVGLLAVMSCWQIGIPAMSVGEKARLFCPSDVAYGDDGMQPVVAGGATLIFDIELLNTRPLDAAPETSAPRPILLQ